MATNLPKTKLLHELLNEEVTALDLAKANAVHTHVEADITDLQAYALANNVLALDNTTAFTPDADYEPATKKYVDDNGGGLTQPQIMARSLGC